MRERQEIQTALGEDVPSEQIVWHSTPSSRRRSAPASSRTASVPTGVQSSFGIACDVGILPRTHGTGLFQRGETGFFSVVTLGSMSQQQKLDTLSLKRRSVSLLYNFRLSASVKSAAVAPVVVRLVTARSPSAPSRPVVLARGVPYTIRLVSEVLGSNGSTSMGSALRRRPCR